MALLLQFVSMAVFTLGAPAFTVLAISYWLQERKRSALFQTFTVLCALAFVSSLASIAFFADNSTFNLLRSLVIASLPPMMAHLVWQQSAQRSGRPVWPTFLLLLYTSAALAALGGVTRWKETFEVAPQMVVGACSLFALAALRWEHKAEDHARSWQRSWNVAIFVFLLFAVVAVLLSENPIFALVPDYLVLIFFAVRLYYTERLAFLDTFVKGGVYLVGGVIILGCVLSAFPSFRSEFEANWTAAWLKIVALLPIWLVAPSAYQVMGRGVDRLLHRRYTPAHAEREFLRATQICNGEEELRIAVVQSLQEIFRCPAIVDFKHRATPEDLDLFTTLAPAGYIRLTQRTSQIPFLSDDRRLLERLAVTCGILLDNVRLRLQQQEQRIRAQELSALASRAELRTLRAQINPHFLFNALNAIAGWIRTEPEFADETVAQLAEVFRYTLHRSQTEWILLQEEVDFIRAYLAVEHARFGNRLEAILTICPEATCLPIPSMIIQPLIENALKHGVAGVAGRSTVTLEVRLCDQNLQIEVHDNGPGFPEGFVLDSVTGGHGLHSITERLRGYYGDAGSLSWRNTAEGTSVRISIPQAVIA